MSEVIDSENWFQYANCKDRTHYFYTDNLPVAESRRLEVIAKSFCNKCIVRDKCLEYALKNNEEYGIWGGLNSKELAKYRISNIRIVEG